MSLQKLRPSKQSIRFYSESYESSNITKLVRELQFDIETHGQNYKIRKINY